MDMAADNVVVPEESLDTSTTKRNSLQTHTWAGSHQPHMLLDRHELSPAIPTTTASPSTSQSRTSNPHKGSFRALLHQVTKLFTSETDEKGPAHYRRGSILIKHLEEKQATGRATEKDMKFFEMVKSHFDANIMESRTIISLSVFQTGSNPMNDPFAVIHMPVVIQQGFRRKLFAIFSIQLCAVVALICLFSYPATIVAAFQPVFSQWHFTFAAFVAMVVALLWLYLVKYRFPLNFVVLTVYTVSQSLFFAGCDYLFETKASIFSFSFLFCIMAITTMLCTFVPKKPVHESVRPVLISYPAVIFVGYLLALLGSLVVYFVYMDDVLSTLQYSASLAAILLLVMWFAYDASCMNERLSPDEYMQGMVFFYTDMVLFLLFLSIIFVACFACEGDCACYGTADIAPIGVAGNGDDDDEGEEGGEALTGDEQLQ